MADKKDDKNAKAPDKAQAEKGAAGEEGAKKSKLPIFIGGGFAALLALAFTLASMAVPKKEPEHRLTGPFVIKLSSKEIQVNLAGDNSKRYLVMSLQAEYFAYDQHYVQARVSGGGGDGHGGGAEDPHYAAMLKNALLSVSATKTLAQVTDRVQVEAFLDEVRKVADPVVFPVLIGHALTPDASDEESGLRAGQSMSEARMRGLLYEHALHVDAGRKTIRLDDGPVIEFSGREHDLRVVDGRGQDVYVDVSELKPEFRGEVHVGVAGNVRKILRDSFLIQ